jgi:geranylgeranyl transferase type-2 subunit alpha
MNAMQMMLQGGNSWTMVRLALSWWLISAYQSAEFDMMRHALYTDSADQSLWFYYQFLLTIIINPAAHKVIVPNFTWADRAEYVDAQIIFLKDLLDGAEDSKWIYNALIDCSTALWKMKGRPVPHEVKQELKMWLDELGKIDPLRGGRWKDLGAILGLKE